MISEGEIMDAKMSSFSSDFQTLARMMNRQPTHKMVFEKYGKNIYSSSSVWAPQKVVLTFEYGTGQSLGIPLLQTVPLDV